MISSLTHWCLIPVYGAVLRSWDVREEHPRNIEIIISEKGLPFKHRWILDCSTRFKSDKALRSVEFMYPLWSVHFLMMHHLMQSIAVKSLSTSNSNCWGEGGGVHCTHDPQQATSLFWLDVCILPINSKEPWYLDGLVDYRPVNSLFMRPRFAVFLVVQISWCKVGLLSRACSQLGLGWPCYSDTVMWWIASLTV